MDFITEKRKKAVNCSEKDFFKLMNNSVYSKTNDNLRKRGKVSRLYNNAKSYKNGCLDQPLFYKWYLVEIWLLLMKLKKVLILHKSIYAGSSVLDLSKLLMYNFHYNCIKAKFDYGAKLLFTDTGILVYEIETDDLYEDFSLVTILKIRDYIIQ